MRILTALIFTALFIHTPLAHALQGEAPLSKTSIGVKTLNQVEQRTLPAIDRAALANEDAQKDAPGVALRFATAYKTAITPKDAGTWEPVKGGQLWRLRYAAPGATDLNFGFTEYKLPEGARLWIVSEQQDYYQGPYTNEHNKPHGILYTPVIPGGNGYIELFVPDNAQDYSLRVTQVARGYRDLFGLHPDSAVKSGACNNDVLCPEADDWRDELRSVARYSNAGLTLCTGQLVMDTDNSSFRNLFLSAFHCAITPANAPAMVVYWNYESPVCGQQGGGSLNQNQTGATYLAGRADVDFLLVELDADPLPEWNVFWGGWDNSGIAALGSVGIHHPAGDEKVISFNFDALTTVDNCASAPSTGTHWEVNNWEDGTTEGGSSGSALWDPNTKLIVGTLTGGGAACGNNESDCYGKFSVSWNGLASPERLSDHLDPGNTGLQQMPSGEPVDFSLSAPALPGVCGTGASATTIAVDVQGAFTDPVTLSVAGLPSGVTPGFTNNPVSPPGTSTMSLTIGSASTGSFPLTVTGSSTSGDRTLNLNLDLSKGTPLATDLLFPANGATGVSPLQKLYWTAASNASTYRVELATDAGFTNIIESIGGLSSTSLSRTSALNDVTTYYWRVISESPCGDTVSASASFTTGSSSCMIYPSSDVPKDILLIPGSVESTVAVSGIGGPVTDVNVVGLQGTHTWFNDLDFVLKAPTDTLVQIMSRSCDGEDNFDLNLDDQATPGAWPCPPVGGGTYQPSSPLAAYNSEDANGTWTLTVSDAVAQDGGSLDAWGLEICYSAPSEVLDTDADGIEDDQDNCRIVENPSQCDTNGDGFGNHCDADLNNNGTINFVDLGMLKNAWESSPPDSHWNADADLNCNDVVNFVDIGLMKGKFLGTPGPSGTTAN